MRYLFETKLLSLSDCKSDRFVVSTMPRKVSLMDNLGRIFDDEYEEIISRDDGYFVGINGKNKSLFDKNGKIIISGFSEAGEFTNEGVSLIQFDDKPNIWIKKDGTIFAADLVPVSDFINGVGIVKYYDNGRETDLVEVVSKFDDRFDIDFGENILPKRKRQLLNIFMKDMSKKMTSDRLIKTGVIASEIASFLNPRYSWVKISKNNDYIIDKKFQIVAGPFEKIYDIFDSDIALCYEHDANTKRPQFFFYNIKLKKRIFEPFKYFAIFEDEIAKIPCFDRNYKYIKRNGNPLNNKSYSTACEFSENLAVVTEILKDSGEHMSTYVRKNGTEFKNWYDVCEDESEGLCAVLYNNRGFFLNEFEEQVGKSFKRVSSFKEKHSVITLDNDRKTYIDRNFKRFIEEFDFARNFSGGFGVVENCGLLDAVNGNQIKLSQISLLAKYIIQKPLTFIDIAEVVSNDTNLLDEFYNLAIAECFKFKNEFESQDYNNYVDKALMDIVSVYESIKNTSEMTSN